MRHRETGNRQGIFTVQIQDVRQKKQERYGRETSNCDGDFICISNGSSLGLFIWQIKFFFLQNVFLGQGAWSFWTPFFLFCRVEKKLFFLFEEGKNTVAPSQTTKNRFLHLAICQRRPPSNIGRSSLPTSSHKNSRSTTKGYFSFHTFSQRINDLEKAKTTKPISRKEKKNVGTPRDARSFFWN